MKKYLMIFCCVLMVLGFQAFTEHQQPKWQNLKILPQDISKKEMDSVMNHFSKALGVKCSFCHVRNNELEKMEFAKDDKMEKLIARGMMQMTIDINKDNFAKHDPEEADRDPHATDSVRYMLKYVTCYTCHGGKERPESKIPADEED